MRLYKYRGGDKSVIKRDLATLAKNEAFAASFASLNDPFESRMLEREASRAEKICAYIAKFLLPDDGEEGVLNFILNGHTWLTKTMENSSSGIYSLSQTPLDELLWAHYGFSHTGFCIEYDLETLLAFNHDVRHLSVVYNSYAPRVGPSDIWKLILGELPIFSRWQGYRDVMLQKAMATKSLSWAYEKEIRLFFEMAGLFSFDYHAVKSIYFGCRCSAKLRALVMRVLAGRGLKYYQVYLDPVDYCLRAEELIDKNKRLQTYIQPIATVGLNIIKHTTSPSADPTDSDCHWIELSADGLQQLEKAIEIVRRRAYCAHVSGAGFRLVNYGGYIVFRHCIFFLSKSGAECEERFNTNLERCSLERYFRKK